MSLFRRLMFSIGLLVLFLLAVSSLVSIYNAQKYFTDQLGTLAEDTATSLGLTISHAAERDDLAEIDSMVDVIFDRGYYRAISYKNFDGDALVSREREVRVEGVPSWFIDLIPIAANVGEAEVVSGWMRLGIIEVHVHPGYAYRELWAVVAQQVWLFGFAAVLSYVLAAMGLRLLLRPLRRVERQADAICRKEFPIQTELPNTPELKRMVLAMNRMVQKIQDMFAQQVSLTDALRRESHMDPLTELPNRKEFDARLNAWMKSESGGAAAVLILLNVSDLEHVNHRLGREAGDAVIKDVAQTLQGMFNSWPEMIAARRSGSDFSAFIPGVLDSDVTQIVEKLHASLQALESVNASASQLDAPLQFHFGVALAQSACDASILLSAADQSLRAVTSDAQPWVVTSVDDKALPIRSAGEWLSFLQGVVDQGALALHFQPVIAADDKRVIHHEAFVRISDNGQVLNAGVFWPLVERYGFVEAMDKAVISRVLAQLAETPNVHLCVNLSPQSMVSAGFSAWLLDHLDRHGSGLERLTVELPEKVLRLPLATVKTFVEAVQARGVSVSLDHFGVTPSSLGVLQSLSFDFVKIDSRFSLTLHEHPENRFYIKSLLQIAHSCDVKVLAEGLEHARDWQALLALGIDGGQGYYFAAPSSSLSPHIDN